VCTVSKHGLADPAITADRTQDNLANNVDVQGLFDVTKPVELRNDDTRQASSTPSQ
jgi:hypothetical protein